MPALVVDRSGFLWVASREGLYGYDGCRAVRYVPDGEDSRSITDLDLRFDGTLWAGTRAGLVRIDAQRWDVSRHGLTAPDLRQPRGVE